MTFWTALIDIALSSTGSRTLIARNFVQSSQAAVMSGSPKPHIQVVQAWTQKRPLEYNRFFARFTVSVWGSSSATYNGIIWPLIRIPSALKKERIDQTTYKDVVRNRLELQACANSDCAVLIRISLKPTCTGKFLVSLGLQISSSRPRGNLKNYAIVWCISDVVVQLCKLKEYLPIIIRTTKFRYL